MALFGSFSSLIFQICFDHLRFIVFTFVLYSIWRRYSYKRTNIGRDFREKNQDADVIIVGCGVIGSVLAAVLGRRNYKVIVVERNFKQPVRIVGELLQPGGVDALKKLGLEDALKGIDAQSSYGYVVHHNEIGTSVKLPYNDNVNESLSCHNCPDYGEKGSSCVKCHNLEDINNDRINQRYIGKSFHHGRFIQNLRKLSDPYQNVIKVEGEATKLLWENESFGHKRILGVQFKSKTGQIKNFKAPLTIVVDGCFSKFRKFLFPPGRRSTPQVNSYFLGLIIPNPDCIATVGREDSHETTRDDLNETPAQSNDSSENLVDQTTKQLFVPDNNACLFGQTFAEVVLGNDPASISSYYTRVLIDIPCPLPKDIKEFLRYEITSQLPEKYRESFLLALKYNEGRDAAVCQHPSPDANNSAPICDNLTLNDDRKSSKDQIEKLNNPYFSTCTPDFLATECDIEPEAFDMKVMPNSYLACPPTLGSLPLGVITLGDALNMRHPLTGGGMTVAMNDAIFWLDRMLPVPDNINVENTTKSNENANGFSNTSDAIPKKDILSDTWLMEGRKSFAYQRSLKYSFAVNVLAQALYQLYASGSDQHLKEMREACFHYFEMGGVCVSGPMSLISITQPKPHILIGHFFAVAIYAIYLNLKKSPNIIKGFAHSWLLLYKACRIIFPLIWNEFNSPAFKLFN